MALFAFDGTNQDDRDSGSGWAAVSSDTNIYRFYSAYQGYVVGTCVNCDYVPGVGTRFGVLGRAIGGAFGVGWLDRVTESYEAQTRRRRVRAGPTAPCIPNCRSGRTRSARPARTGAPCSTRT
jgi:Uncharacterized alpha/beta hydrolase domain (DUF2235)